MCNFREIFVLYVQREVLIKHPEHGSIPHNLERLQKKAIGWSMPSNIRDHRPHDPTYLEVLLETQLFVYQT